MFYFFHSKLPQANTPEPVSDISGHQWPSTERSWEWLSVQPSFKVLSIFFQVLRHLWKETVPNISLVSLRSNKCDDSGLGMGSLYKTEGKKNKTVNNGEGKASSLIV